MQFNELFKTPVFQTFDDSWLHLDKKCDPIINHLIKKHSKDKIKPNSYHSDNLWTYPDFLDFSKHILSMSWSFLSKLGYDLDGRSPLLTELWVQEFPKEGGYHDIHVHGNNHVSGFYFLKCSDKTSFPLFHDPRPGKIMTDLRLKDKKQISYGQHQIKYNVKPGDLYLFPSYLPHSYMSHKGKEKFRFIHFNMQCVLSDNITKTE